MRSHLSLWSSSWPSDRRPFVHRTADKCIRVIGADTSTVASVLMRCSCRGHGRITTGYVRASLPLLWFNAEPGPHHLQSRTRHGPSPPVRRHSRSIHARLHASNHLTVRIHLESKTARDQFPTRLNGTRTMGRRRRVLSALPEWPCPQELCDRTGS